MIDKCGLTGDEKTNAVVEMQTCKDKGMGVFTLKDIAVGGEIHREKPLVIYDNGGDFEDLGVAPTK